MVAGGELGLLTLLKGFGTSGPVVKEKKMSPPKKTLVKLGDFQLQTAGGASVRSAWS